VVFVNILLDFAMGKLYEEHKLKKHVLLAEDTLYVDISGLIRCLAEQAVVQGLQRHTQYQNVSC